MLPTGTLPADTEQVVRLIGATRLRRTDQASRQARRAVAWWLGEDHPLLFEVAQVVSELVNNSLIHATAGPHRDWISVSVNDGTTFLRVYVTDPGGPTMPRVLNTQRSDESGRGMRIVHVLSQGHWATYETEEGHRIVRVDLRHPLPSQDKNAGT